MLQVRMLRKIVGVDNKRRVPLEIRQDRRMSTEELVKVLEFVNVVVTELGLR